MKRTMAGMMMAGMVMAGGQSMAEGSAGVDVATAYVFRGATFNDGLVVQPGAKVVNHGVTLGAWGNLDIDDYQGAVADNQFSEVDLYGSYALPIDAVALSVGYTEYTYPGAEGEADREVSVSLGFSVPTAPSLALYYGVDGGIDKALYVEGALSHSLALAGGVSLTLGAAVGYVEPDEGEGGFSHYTASAGLGYACLSAKLMYVGQLDEDVLPDGVGAYDVDVLAVFGLSGGF